MSKPVRLLVRYGTFEGERARRRDPLLLEALPWWSFLLLGLTSYALMRWAAPHLVPKTTFSPGLVAGIHSDAIFALYAGLIFAAISAAVAGARRP